jgi:signal transduction histidine kinase
MIKSIYARVILFFLGAVIISLIAASMITGYIYDRKLTEQAKNDLVQLSKDIFTIYEKTNLDLQEITNIQSLKGYSFYIFNEKGFIESYRVVDKKAADAIESMSPDIYQKVINGEVYQTFTGTDETLTVGLPFQMKDGIYALFIRPEIEDLELVGEIIFMTISITLLTGSLIFLIAATYIVKPIRKLTIATQRMAKGEFDVHLNLKRKDELGVLAQSFDHMAGELSHLEQMRQDFVSNVSHEIQSPLTSISGFAKALQNNSIAENDRFRYLNIIAAESDRLSKLSDNLLKLASLESDQHPFKPETYRLDEQIRQALVLYEPQWSAKNLNVIPELPIIKIKADRDQLSQVWNNLLGNSIKFTPDNGQIRIRINQDMDNVMVTIADSGIGISSEDQGRMFDRFFKADKSHSRAQGGNGLGLAIVKKIISLHHGDIQVSSTIGKGTQITVIIPSYNE